LPSGADKFAFRWSLIRTEGQLWIWLVQKACNSFLVNVLYVKTIFCYNYFLNIVDNLELTLLLKLFDHRKWRPLRRFRSTGQSLTNSTWPTRNRKWSLSPFCRPQSRRWPTEKRPASKEIFIRLKVKINLKLFPSSAKKQWGRVIRHKTDRV
jgi:hypothetical protein